MKNLRIIATFMFAAIIFTGCEKEDDSLSSGLVENNTTGISKQASLNSKAMGPWRHLYMKIVDGELKGCPTEGCCCEVIVITPSALSPFFDNNDDYIAGSFSNNYSDAVDLFHKFEVDQVINGLWTVELYTNSSNQEFVRFYDVSNGDNVATTQINY